MHERATPPRPAGAQPDATRVQILATEHWSLLATRSMGYNEIFSRTGIFLTVLSASVVALALVAQATDFGDGFYLFALLVLPVVLLLGVGTFLRLGDALGEDTFFLAGMNRLRHAYLELAPDLEPYFVTGRYDDERGILQSWGPLAHTRNSRILSSTPTIVGVVNAVVAGVVSGLIAEVAGAPPVGSILIGAAATGLAIALAVRFALGNIRLLRSTWEPRFPHPVENERAPS